MKFPRNAKIFRGQWDAAPFAGVFFLLVIFLLLASLVYTPGVIVRLPASGNLAGTTNPTIAVAVDAGGRLYFENQLIQETDLKTRLAKVAADSSEPLTLVIQADKEVPYDRLMQLTMMAQDAGIREALLATLPRVYAAPQDSSPSQP